MSTRQSELSVITKAKNLSSYIYTITQKSPKQFRFMLVARMQNYSIDIIEHLYKANDTFVRSGDVRKAEIRRDNDCAACRRGKGTKFAEDRMTQFLRRFYGGHGTKGYILKCDIRKYFDNIDHEVLKDRWKNFPDERV